MRVRCVICRLAKLSGARRLAIRRIGAIHKAHLLAAGLLQARANPLDPALEPGSHPGQPSHGPELFTVVEDLRAFTSTRSIFYAAAKSKAARM